MMRWIRQRLRGLFSRAMAVDIVLCAWCAWSVYIQMRYRVPGQWIFLVLPWLGIVMTAVSVLSLGIRAVSQMPTKDPLRHDLRLFQLIGRTCLVVFIGYGEFLYFNSTYDRSEPMAQRSVILDMSDGEFDIGGLVPYARAELQSWHRPSGSEYVFLHRTEQWCLWVKEPVLVKVRQGALGIPWVENIEEDQEVRLRQVLKIAPTATAAWKQLLWFYLNEKKWDDAVKTATDYFQYYPDDAQTYHGAANTLFMYRQFRAAIEILEPVLAHRPNFKIYQMASWTLGQDGRPDSKQRALQLASAMVQMEPNNPIGYYNLGYVNYWMNRPMDALVAFEKLLALWPDPPEIDQIMEQLRKQVGQTSSNR